MHLFQATQLLVGLALDLRGHLGLVDLLSQFADLFGAVVAFAELLLNLFHLLAQEVVPLGLGHLFFRLVLDARLHGREFELAGK